jgi:hypothetical protein
MHLPNPLKAVSTDLPKYKFPLPYILNGVNSTKPSIFQRSTWRTMPSKSERSNKPVLRMNQVPTINQLVNNLGFEGALRPQTDKFLAAVHSWRKTYTTDDGRPGKELLKWNDSQVQIELGLMAERFVLSNGPGTDWDWFESSDLEYPDDKKEYVVAKTSHIKGLTLVASSAI